MASSYPAAVVLSNSSRIGIFSVPNLVSLSRSASPLSLLNSSSRTRCYSTQKIPYVGKEKGRGKQGWLVLEDGTVFKGYSFGSEKAISGEVVFNTAMVGYPESLTDPSYSGQILSFTYPLIGNYGVPPKEVDQHGLLKFFESDKIHVNGVICSDYTSRYSHWAAEKSLGDWLKEEGIPALEGVDTRALTKKIRERGAMLGKIIFDEDFDISNPFKKNLVAEVSVPTVRTFTKPGNKARVLAIDCGMKNNIIRALVDKGADLKVVPWDYDINGEDWDGLFISNGPGDPSMAAATVKNIRKAMERGKPIFGICLGNQLLALAAGGKTYKLKFGNRGQNQPAMDLTTNRTYITPQNHGFAVDTASLPPDWKPFFINANDFSNEGIMCVSKPYFSVQFHPEAKGGPYDTEFLFDKFIDKVNELRATDSGTTQLAPKRGVNKAIILGSGALQIGQAGEFDYSGSQAIKALKEEGVKTVLINPNIATVQTAKGLADRVYFLPVTPRFVEDIIKKEKPDGILLAFGGQTALNCGVALEESGILKKYGVRVLGTPVSSIQATEDRGIFADKLHEISQPIAESVAVDNVDEALKVAHKIGYPIIIRAAFALGGLGSGFCNNDKELVELANKALASSPQILVEKSLKGWKEVEYEVVRDAYDNCITVCNMENFDPLGIHTGESIVIAPSQTLTNEEYHKLRMASINTIRHLGIVGECNIQYALDPFSEEYCIIEVNARLSRSSALASKATGYPLAFVAAKIGLGISLPQIHNSITKVTTACFEPSLDYCVVKIPRWDLKKFERVSPLLGSSMKSVGEVMSIGRTFEEALQKALRMVDTSNGGFESKIDMKKVDIAAMETELTKPTPNRIFALNTAIKLGYSTEKLYELTRVDPWFLSKLEKLVRFEGELAKNKLENLTREFLHQVKNAGFSDKQIAKYIGSNELAVRDYRKRLGVVPVVKQIDTLAAEFPAQTNYLFVTYGGTENDIPKNSRGVLVLGSGVYRIGSSVEFDYCSVMTARALRAAGKQSILINYNPETVSTDYDESERLYFEELSLERVMDIHDFESPEGVVVSVGGQQPNNLALPLHKLGVNILGTSALDIDRAEDRQKFSALLDELGIDQPAWKELAHIDDALKFADNVGYPVLIRPSYVLSGAAMKVSWNKEELLEFLGKAADVSPEHPVVISKFIEGAREVEVDAVAHGGKLINHAISEHIEFAGVHSGDATMVLPPHTVPPVVQSRLREISTKIAKALNISGPMNCQFLWKGDEIKVIECNVRASRSFPFVSKTYNVDFIETATRIWLGENMQPNPKCSQPLNHVGVKAPQFSFQRLLGADPVLSTEMASTGELACFGKTMHEAFLKAMEATHGFRLPKRSVLISGGVQPSFVSAVKNFRKSGLQVFATPEAAEVLKAGGFSDFTALSHEEGQSSVLKTLGEKAIDLTVNFPARKENPNQYNIRRKTVDYGVPLLTNENVAAVLAEALTTYKHENLHITAYDEYFPEARA